MTKNEVVLPISRSNSNPIYFSYIKGKFQKTIFFLSENLDELERLQDFVNRQAGELEELDRDAIEQRSLIESRLADYKAKIVKLSSTTKLLSPLTAFVGVKKDEKKE